MPRALARSAYGTSRRIGEAGISIARLESLTLLNATPVTFDTHGANPNPSYWSAKRPPNIPELPVRASAETAAKITIRSSIAISNRLHQLNDIFLSKIATLVSSVCMIQDAVEGGVNTTLAS